MPMVTSSFACFTYYYLLIIAEVRSHQDLRQQKKIGEERRGDYPEAGINLEYEGKTNLK